MYVTMIFIVLYGTFDVGGFSYVWQKAVESGRADLVDWDPTRPPDTLFGPSLLVVTSPGLPSTAATRHRYLVSLFGLTRVILSIIFSRGEI